MISDDNVGCGEFKDKDILKRGLGFSLVIEGSGC